MARSPLILAASVCAALPDAEVTRSAPLTTNATHRSDSAVVTLADGRVVVVRIPNDDAVASELSTEMVALRALTDGARALVHFSIPEFLATAPTPPTLAFVTTFIPGYQVDTVHIPAGPGVAYSLGSALAQLHSLPVSIVRNAGLPARSAYEVRDDLEKIVEASAATGRVPVRLMVRWRDAITNDVLWQFEPTVSLGGANALNFVYADVDNAPSVAGVIGWQGLSIGDPALDLQFLQSAPEAAESVLDAYRTHAHRSGDEYLHARSRLHAELEFARWLLHGRNTNDDEIVEEASAMLDALAENVRDEDLLPLAEKPQLNDALAALQNLAPRVAAPADTSMHTDVYDPDELAISGVSLSEIDSVSDPLRDSRVVAASTDTQALSAKEVDEWRASSNEKQSRPVQQESPAASLPFGLVPFEEETDRNDTQPLDPNDATVLTDEAARAARAAINRWKSDPV